MQLATVLNEDIHKWVLATGDLEPSNGSIAGLYASLDGFEDRQHSDDTPKGLSR